jgi:hypothetical protein
VAGLILPLKERGLSTDGLLDTLRIRIHGQNPIDSSELLLEFPNLLALGLGLGGVLKRQEAIHGALQTTTESPG